jgi:hypothetical protein
MYIWKLTMSEENPPNVNLTFDDVIYLKRKEASANSK